MNFEQVIGNRRSTRFFDPDRPVEREKIQKILEAMRLSSCAMNAHWLRAVVVYRDELDDELFERLKVPVTGVLMELAPVHIYCFADPTIVPKDKGNRVKELIDVHACNPSHGWTYKFVEEHAWPAVLKPLSESPTYPAMMAWDDGGAAMQGLLMAINQGLGACYSVMVEDVAKEAFGVPDEWLPHYVMNIGYSLEDPGQRPRPPFDSLYYERHVDTPFERDEKVVKELEEAGMLQDPEPKPGRKEEVRRLCQQLGLVE